MCCRTESNWELSLRRWQRPMPSQMMWRFVRSVVHFLIFPLRHPALRAQQTLDSRPPLILIDGLYPEETGLVVTKCGKFVYSVEVENEFLLILVQIVLHNSEGPTQTLLKLKLELARAQARA